MVSLEFFIDIIHPAALWPRGRAFSNRNEYREYFLHMLLVLKSGSLNLLEPSGPVQSCNGNALSLAQ